MHFTVVTQTRGDAARIAEWVEYHARLGFDDFQIILDGVVDETPEILASLDVPAAVTVHRFPEEGVYHDHLEPAERQRALVRWRAENAEMRAALPHRAFDPQSVRQIQRVSNVLEPYQAGERGSGWAAHIDVDEFINLTVHRTIGELLAEIETPRLWLHSFNVDTTGHDPTRPVLEQHRWRWSREDLVAHPNRAWANRVKSIVRYRRVLPFRSIHRFGRGRHTVVDHEIARLHHYRVPPQPLTPEVAYSVDDPITMPRGPSGGHASGHASGRPGNAREASPDRSGTDLSAVDFFGRADRI